MDKSAKARRPGSRATVAQNHPDRGTAVTVDRAFNEGSHPGYIVYKTGRPRGFFFVRSTELEK